MPTIPQDKANHVIYGAIVALLVAALTSHLNFPLPGAFGLGAAVFVGSVKEAGDAFENHRLTGAVFTGPHGVEWKDFFATALGGLIVLLASLVGA